MLLSTDDLSSRHSLLNSYCLAKTNLSMNAIWLVPRFLHHDSHSILWPSLSGLPITTSS